MATGQQGFDPDDFIRRDRESDERAREQQRIDEMRRSQERDQARRAQERDATLRRLMDVVNDPDITVDKEMVKSINDPEQVMTANGEVARITRRTGLGSQFGAQFGSGFGFNLPVDAPAPRRRRRKKNPKLAKAMREANARGRKKNGGFKKGYDQARIARLAQRLLKKMK